MNQLPPFHPDWLVSFWFSMPILRSINPHWFLITIAVMGLVIFFARRKGKSLSAPLDSDEQQFQHLLTKKQIIEKKLVQLENQRSRGELSEENFQRNFDEYKKHLDKVNLDLLYYT
ncbi:hypothetical protein [Bacillus sp. T3]|uniref:hypothetical protein n=1 Tax=Bacillus sp. T3 TaxID=467262 RepID=UPI002980CD5D|nr:hypothetical protein [Bacillus sp. T3]